MAMMDSASRPSVGAAAALALLTAFTVFITWRAKQMELGLTHTSHTALPLKSEAPSFLLRGLDGRNVALSDFAGKKSVIVTFWASWCGPCRAEMPALVKFYEKKAAAGADFELLAISIDDDLASAQKAATEMKLPFPVLMDSSHSTAEAYAVEAIPTLLIIDPRGRVTFNQTGLNPGLEMMLDQYFHLAGTAISPGVPNAGGH